MTARTNSDSGMTPLEVLGKYWGYDSFRPCQAEIIDSVLAGHDTLGLLPTGGGKSLTFQIPALILDGLTVVVTPLISLMKDQVDNLAERGIRASYIYSGLTRREVRLACDRCRYGKSKMLYVSPERLHSENFLTEMRKWDISLLVVDEAHCISQWGYDFRPSYLRIAELRELLGHSVPVLALTASATPRVREDIMTNLRFGPDARVFTLSFDRTNLSYAVRMTDNKFHQLVTVLQNVPGSTIVYLRSRKRTREVAMMLEERGITASFYHAGLDPDVKRERQEAWKKSGIRVMVATNAFGMGIDKPDVRIVIHYDVPSTLEEYYQEAGRAGRDGLPAYAVLIVASYEKGRLTRHLNDAFPPIEYVRNVYELLGAFLSVPVGEGYRSVHEFSIDTFCEVYRLQKGAVSGALSLLTQAGYIEFVEESMTPSRVMMTCNRDELYHTPLTKDEETILTQILRTCPGVFSDYIIIREEPLAISCGIPVENIYPTMLSLGRKGLLHYVPRRDTPYVYYTTAREETRYITLPRSVYEERRRLMEQRLDAVREFVYGTEKCRSKVLLEYFGEKDVRDCGRCDICRRRRRQASLSVVSDEKRADDAAARILEALASGPAEAMSLGGVLGLGKEDYGNAVRDLVISGRIVFNGITLRLP